MSVYEGSGGLCSSSATYPPSRLDNDTVHTHSLGVQDDLLLYVLEAHQARIGDAPDTRAKATHARHPIQTQVTHPTAVDTG